MNNKIKVDYKKLSSVLAEGITKAMTSNDIIVEGERFTQKQIDKLILESMIECLNCKSIGFVPCPKCGEKEVERESECKTCNGAGSVKCSECEGGYLTESRTDPSGLPLLREWQDALHDVYDGDYDEFVQYDDLYNISQRLGFGSPEEAWYTNPVIQGSVNPGDLKIANSELEVDDEFDQKDENDIENHEGGSDWVDGYGTDKFTKEDYSDELDGHLRESLNSKKKDKLIKEDAGDLFEQPIWIEDEKFDCIRINEETDKLKGTKGYIVYDKNANMIGKFNHVRSTDELEYLVERKLTRLATKAPETANDLELIRRRNIQNKFVENPYLEEAKVAKPKIAKAPIETASTNDVGAMQSFVKDALGKGKPETQSEEIVYKEKLVKNQLDRVTAIINDKNNPVFPLASRIRELRDEIDKADKEEHDLVPQLRELLEQKIFDEKYSTVTRVAELADQLIVTLKRAPTYQGKISGDEYEEIISKLIPLIAKNVVKATEMYKQIRATYEKAPTIGQSAIAIKHVTESFAHDLWTQFKLFMSQLFHSFDVVSLQIDELLEIE